MGTVILRHLARAVIQRIHGRTDRLLGLCLHQVNVFRVTRRLLEHEQLVDRSAAAERDHVIQRRGIEHIIAQRGR